MSNVRHPVNSGCLRIGLTAALVAFVSTGAVAQQVAPVVPAVSDSPADALLRRWLPSALAGEAEGQYKVGMMQLYGRGGAEKNVDSGLAWLRKSAAQGFSEAEVELGVVYKVGLTAAADRSAAKSWFESAAQHGNARAQLLLGTMLDDSRDYNGAVYWYRKSAAQGRSDAQLMLGMMYLDGLGVPRNLPVALAWFKVSSSSGNEESRAQIERISTLLSLAEARRAEAMARSWKPGLSDLHLPQDDGQTE